MPKMAKRITTQDLHNRLHIIETNHLAHIEQDLDNLDTAVKENRKYFETRLDRLDNRIWGLVLLTISTLGATIAGMML
jgi:ribosome assembly protein YihI (activator of Der GTPase)